MEKENLTDQITPQTLGDIRLLADFLGPRDFPLLTRQSLKTSTGLDQADAFVLFGGSILEGVEVLHEAIENHLARTYVIVGGAGHTTQSLRDKARELFVDVRLDEGVSEARLFETLLESRYGMKADLLEEKSTNCGNNITFLLDVLEKNKVSWNSVILCQDSSMQRRMSAGLEKQLLDQFTAGSSHYMLPKTIINYAVSRPQPVIKEGRLAFDHEPLGMWKPERYLSLLLGEIPRLYDSPEGYGPNGAGYIAHVDSPQPVLEAFKRLALQFPELIRQANPAFAS